MGLCVFDVCVVGALWFCVLECLVCLALVVFVFDVLIVFDVWCG